MGKELMTYGAYIDGKWQDGKGEAFTSTDPATGETVWQGKAASPEQVELGL